MNKISLMMTSVIILMIFETAFAQTTSIHAHDMKYYVLYDDGGEHPADSYRTVKTLPHQLTMTNRKSAGYLGTKQTEFSSKNEASIDAYDHYYATLNECQSALKKLSDNQ